MKASWKDEYEKLREICSHLEKECNITVTNRSKSSQYGITKNSEYEKKIHSLRKYSTEARQALTDISTQHRNEKIQKAKGKCKKAVALFERNFDLLFDLIESETQRLERMRVALDHELQYILDHFRKSTDLNLDVAQDSL